MLGVREQLLDGVGLPVNPSVGAEEFEAAGLLPRPRGFELSLAPRVEAARRLAGEALGKGDLCGLPLPPMAIATSTAAVPQSETIRSHAAFIWSVADLLRGDYKQSEYGKVVLPLTVIRRLDCVLEPTKQAVLEKHKQLAGKIENVEPVLQAVAGEQFYNTSPLTFTKLLDDPNTIADSLQLYIGGFSEAAKDVIDKFDFGIQIDRLRKANVLYQVVGKFSEIDLHPEAVSNIEMGYLYEELIRRFSELSNETAGEHFTPREVIRLMVNLLFIDDADDVLTKPGILKTLCDPACGTGGMLSVAEDHLRALNPQARLEVFGQELNAETATRFPKTTTRASATTIYSRTRRLGSSGRRSSRKSAKRRRRKASTGASARVYHASTTARSSSCST